MERVELTGEALTIEQVVAVARHGVVVAPLNEDVVHRMQQSRDWLDGRLAQPEAVVYGVNTGFGPLATTRITAEQTRVLSRNVILACLVGVGQPLPPDVVRAMMLIRANTFALGHSGVRPQIAETLIQMLNLGVTPYVPGKGSLGASGDLAPLAHIAVVFTRDPAPAQQWHSGRAWYAGELLSGAEAMHRAGLAPLILEAKEGLALTNGTEMMLAMAALALADAQNLLVHAEIAAALSFEALLGISQALHPALHAGSRQPGQIACAAHLRRLLAGSQLVDSQPERVQDPYSLRCIPQVLGPVRDILNFLASRIVDGLNAAIDNPLIFLDGDGAGAIVSGGNFHGQGPGLWLDSLASTISVIANIAERRIFRLLTPELSNGLPAMLTRGSGLNSGMMMLQYTAAALVSDNKTLAHPDSSDSIPSSGNQEDHVSMGANAARHAWEILENVRHVVAIELLTAAQGVDLREDGPERLAPATRAVYDRLRSVAPTLSGDREFTADIAAVTDLLRAPALTVAQ